MDRNLRALQRRDPRDVDAVALAAGYLRRGQAQAALAALGEAPPPQAAEVLDQAWGELLAGLRRVASHRVDGRMRCVGEAAGQLVLEAAGPGGRLTWWPFDPTGAQPPARLPAGPYTPVACAPRGLLVDVRAYGGGGGQAWAAPPDWEPGELVGQAALPRSPGELADVDPTGARAHWPQGLWSLPDLAPVALPSEAEAARRSREVLRVAWATDRVVWVVGENVLSQPLRGGPVARWKPYEAWRRQHPAQAASAGRDDLGLTVLHDGRLCTRAPLAVHDPERDVTWFPNRGDGERLTGEPRLSHDGEALLLFRGGLPCRVPLAGKLPPRPAAAVAAGIWHPQAACALVRALPATPAEVRDAHGRARFRFPHGLRPVCWCPDGRGVVLQRELGAGAGPLEVWRIPEGT